MSLRTSTIRKWGACLAALPAGALVLALRGYQIFISPILPGACRFYPTCSSYAMHAVATHGVVKGGWLALRRIVRCHPWGGNEYDPVPGLPETAQSHPTPHGGSCRHAH